MLKLWITYQQKWRWIQQVDHSALSRVIWAVTSEVLLTKNIACLFLPLPFPSLPLVFILVSVDARFTYS